MSSISIDGSGQRGMTMTVNEPVRTFASIPTKGDDDLSVHISGVGEITVVLPPTAEIGKVKKGEDELLVLKLKGSMQISAANVGGEHGGWPHASVSVRKWKEGEGYLSDAEVIDEQPVTALFESQEA